MKWKFKKFQYHWQKYALCANKNLWSRISDKVYYIQKNLSATNGAHTIACKTTDLKNSLLNFQAFMNRFLVKVISKVQDITLSLRTSYLMFINYI